MQQNSTVNCARRNLIKTLVFNWTETTLQFYKLNESYRKEFENNEGNRKKITSGHDFECNPKNLNRKFCFELV